MLEFIRIYHETYQSTYYVTIQSNINLLQNLRGLKYHTNKRNTCIHICLYTTPSGYPSVLLEQMRI